MQILGIILIVFGIFALAGFILQFPFFYNNPKAKLLIKHMGKNGYNVLIILFGLGMLVAGILLI